MELLNFRALTATMKYLTTALFLLLTATLDAQEINHSTSVALSTGFMNYSGDLKPSGFTLSGGHPFLSLSFHKPVTGFFAVRSGIGIGKVAGDDRMNRDYLQQRNLRFQSTILEANAAVELSIMAQKKLSPYLFGGLAVFGFNPWTSDEQGSRVYLKPLSTEGQGLHAYPDRKPYGLTQMALLGGFGFRYRLSEPVAIGFEFIQRKTFTDYLDDVSSTYVDEALLLAARGPQAVALAFRGDELSGTHAYPRTPEQRGTPGQKDWYYSMGVTASIRISALKDASTIAFRRKDWYDRKCPSVH
jgi:hypothetical protein